MILTPLRWCGRRKYNCVENVMARGEHYYNNKEDFDSLKSRNIPAYMDTNTNQIKRSMCSWSFPPNAWFKANFDGVAKGNPGPAGCGGVIWNGAGFYIGAVAFPLGIQTNNLAEAMGTLQTIKLAYNLSVKVLWLEGDSKNIINCLLGKHQPSWMIKNIIDSVREFLEGFDKCYISHEYRESNMCANWAANEAVQSEQIKIWNSEAELPHVAHDILIYEIYHGKQG
ncbi:uncharacterized protein LOC131066407 [Cryptomeria japonica]|uniref:uncharacterized protein LOC131066407 n=1 Tax=Cryptomeria japonica TaxID=3369 RepID=UPI0027DA461E|nr:uncharacterized protein LOC131066407 [Cryptomeria japonica]